MSSQRTVTKVIFHDSSDDDAPADRAPTVFVDVRTDTLCMDETDMVDPEEHFRRCEDIVGQDDANDGFIEDVVPDMERAKGTLAYNHATTVEVAVMSAPASRAERFAIQQQRQGRRPEGAAEAHSTRKRLRDDDDEISARADTEDGLTTDGMVAAAEGHGLPAIGYDVVDALDLVEAEVVKAVMLPNGTNKAPLAIKMSADGYRLSLDENDVQDVFEDEGEDFGEEEEDEEEAALELLMAVSAIEQMIGACERYQPNEEDGGMIPQDNDANADSDSENKPEAEPAAIRETPVEEPPAVGSSSDAVTGDQADPTTATTIKRLIHRPRIFDSFIAKGKELLAKLHEKEITADEFCEAMEEDVEQLQKAFRRINRPNDQPIYIDGVKMDF